MVALTVILLLGLVSVLNANEECKDIAGAYYCEQAKNNGNCNLAVNANACKLTCDTCLKDVCADAYPDYCKGGKKSIGFCDIKDNEEKCKDTCNQCPKKKVVEKIEA